MQKDIVDSLTEDFEVYVQKTDDDIEYLFARDIQNLLGYTEWRNFEGVIKRAIGIIRHKHLHGTIEQTARRVKIGSGASREIVDYKLDKEATQLLQELCSSYKLNNYFFIRNESVVLQLVEKYCRLKQLIFNYQFRLDEYIFDCMLGNRILIEFDEPHHSNPGQKKTDLKKEQLAKQNGFLIFRVNLNMDIIDIIIFIEINL
jgi:very-short-patch-repair endonuclease